jgi:putative sigma-54 modulation protein
VQIVISARHGNLTNGTQQFIREKGEKLLRFFERLTRIEFTVDLQDANPVVELLVSAEHKHDFVARETATTVHAGVDLVLHKMEQQLKRYKQKVQGHRNRNASTRQIPQEGGGAPTGSEDEA